MCLLLVVSLNIEEDIVMDVKRVQLSKAFIIDFKPDAQKGILQTQFKVI